MATNVINPVLNTNEAFQTYDIKINNEPLNLTKTELQQVSISNASGLHESAIITTLLNQSKVEKFINKIVSFSYGPSGRRNTFYGYVVSVNPNRNYMKDTVVDITCLGTTWPMQTGQPRWFTNKSVTDIAAEIVGNFPLGFIGDRSTYQWPSLAQAEQSDWEFLNELALRAGYSVYSYSGVVRFVNPANIMNSTVPVRSLIKGDDIFDKTRVLLDFTPTSESLKMRQNVSPSFGFFSGTNADSTAAVSDTPSAEYRFTTDAAITDKAMADVYLKAWKRRTDFWKDSAKARINGDATIVPGVLVNIQISRSVAAPNENDGPWLVHGVEHSITHNSFQTELTLVRDGVLRRTNTTFGGITNNSVKPKVLQGRSPSNELRWESSQKNSPIFLAEYYGATIS